MIPIIAFAALHEVAVNEGEFHVVTRAWKVLLISISQVTWPSPRDADRSTVSPVGLENDPRVNVSINGRLGLDTYCTYQKKFRPFPRRGSLDGIARMTRTDR